MCLWMRLRSGVKWLFIMLDKAIILHFLFRSLKGSEYHRIGVKTMRPNWRKNAYVHATNIYITASRRLSQCNSKSNGYFKRLPLCFITYEPFPFLNFPYQTMICLNHYYYYYFGSQHFPQFEMLIFWPNLIVSLTQRTICCPIHIQINYH